MLTSSFLLSPSRSSCFIRVLNLLSHWCSYNFELTHDAKHTKIRARSDIYVQHTTDINQKYRENSQQTRLWWAHSNTPQLAQLPHRLHAGNFSVPYLPVFTLSFGVYSFSFAWLRGETALEHVGLQFAPASYSS